MTERGAGRAYEGLIKIIRFNVRFYLGSAALILVTTLVLRFSSLPDWLEAAAILGLVFVLFWTLSSIAVSWYVYDYAAVTHWEWMRPHLRRKPQRWVNIHAGLDESTAWLRRLLPGTDGIVIDIYDPLTMTEPSIVRARRMYPAIGPSLVGSAEALPLPDSDRDTSFLLFAAHELRDSQQRTQLLSEVNRVLKAGGNAVLVEHLRNLPNFIAFGPGFFHFHSYRSWLSSIHGAGLKVVQQRAVTPFVRCFILQKADA